MHRCRKLSGCTLFITGASRGIGKAIALKAARDGANVVIAAKTAETHPKLPGTIYTAAEESKNLLIQTASRSRWSVRVVFKNRWSFYQSVLRPSVEAAGGKALPCVVDVRDEKQVSAAVENAVQKFGGERRHDS